MLCGNHLKHSKGYVLNVGREVLMMNPTAFCLLLVFLSEIIESTVIIISLGVTQLALVLSKVKYHLKSSQRTKQ